jgi:hypothetical protein
MKIIVHGKEKIKIFRMLLRYLMRTHTNDVNITIENDGLKISALDQEYISYIYVKLSPKWFDLFEFQGCKSIKIMDIRQFISILSNTSINTLEIVIQQEDNILVTVSSSSFEIEKIIAISSSTIASNHITIEIPKNSSSFFTTAKDFNCALKNYSKNNIIRFIAKNGSLKIENGLGDEDKITTTIDKMVIDKSDGIDNIDVSFRQKYLETIFNETSKSNLLANINLCNEYPIKIKFLIDYESNSFINYYISPTIPSE